ncbi:hypothetical protein BKG60_00515 [Mycobacterium syngnathidarum]|uniref:Uncharacterized protein n=1 Tax=Mycobacterium syngnathidarum TaxID=1908205 RepID=A0A1Q9WI66_9MYCO|nr:hypothetical protein BKG61_04570 [Mycobacterium syngnathidarum]OLT98493.1 hypothetical protein BKG60_00515 [Mycobacterium syngnathidarum]
MRRISAVALPLTLAAVFALSACAASSNNGQQMERTVTAPAAKTTSNPVRHELEPLTKRFPALGSPVAASWVSGDMGDPEVPGPSLYWIDSIVELTPSVAEDLKTRYRPIPTTNRPGVWESLHDSLPQGGFLASDQLDAAFTSSKIKSKAFLAEDAPIIVITATGE